MRITHFAIIVSLSVLTLLACGEKKRSVDREQVAQPQPETSEERAYFGPECQEVNCYVEARNAAITFVQNRKPTARINGVAARELDRQTWLIAVDIGQRRSIEIIVRWFVTDKVAVEGQAGDYWRADLVNASVLSNPAPSTAPDQIDDQGNDSSNDLDQYPR